MKNPNTTLVTLIVVIGLLISSVSVATAGSMPYLNDSTTHSDHVWAEDLIFNMDQQRSANEEIKTFYAAHVDCIWTADSSALAEIYERLGIAYLKVLKETRGVPGTDTTNLIAAAYAAFNQAEYFWGDVSERYAEIGVLINNHVSPELRNKKDINLLNITGQQASQEERAGDGTTKIWTICQAGLFGEARGNISNEIYGDLSDLSEKVSDVVERLDEHEDSQEESEQNQLNINNQTALTNENQQDQLDQQGRTGDNNEDRINKNEAIDKSQDDRIDKNEETIKDQDERLNKNEETEKTHEQELKEVKADLEKVNAELEKQKQENTQDKEQQNLDKQELEEQRLDLEKQIENLQEQIDQQQIDEQIEEQVDQERQEDVDQDQQNQINQLKQAQNNSAEGISESFDSLSRANEGLGKKVDGIGDKVKDLGDKTDGIGDKVKDLGDKTDGLGDKVKDLGDKTDGLGDKVKGLGDKTDGLGDKVKGLGDKTDSLGQKVEKLGIRTDSLGIDLTNKIDKVEENLTETIVSAIAAIPVPVIPPMPDIPECPDCCDSTMKRFDSVDKLLADILTKLNDGVEINFDSIMVKITDRFNRIDSTNGELKADNRQMKAQLAYLIELAEDTTSTPVTGTKDTTTVVHKIPMTVGVFTAFDFNSDNGSTGGLGGSLSWTEKLDLEVIATASSEKNTSLTIYAAFPLAPYTDNSILSSLTILVGGGLNVDSKVNLKFATIALRGRLFKILNREVSLQVGWIPGKYNNGVRSAPDYSKQYYDYTGVDAKLLVKVLNWDI